jgi:hypothetical protein
MISLGSDDILDIDFLDDGEPVTDPVLDILESENPDLTEVIKVYWKDIQAEVSEAPLLKLYVATLYKMAKEYTRLETQILNMDQSVDDMGGNPLLTNERARLRDNMASMVTEGWKLLSALLTSLQQVQNMIQKLKGTKEESDPFESFNSGDD